MGGFLGSWPSGPFLEYAGCSVLRSAVETTTFGPDYGQINCWLACNTPKSSHRTPMGSILL